MITKGNLHPLTQMMRKAADIFYELGFDIVEGPEIEDEWHNFDSLNIPASHPSRDIQDTFWLTDGNLLRTHTSAEQVRAMENRKPPVRIIVPGRCFRHEATDATHEANFFQLEGFMIDRKVTMAHLIGTLEYFTQKIFGKDIKIRFTPSYYPFGEPGMDMAIWWDKNRKEGKWLEILGSGMIHPVVLKNMKVDPQVWSGFAFGMGIDRLMMLKTGVKDIRLSYQNDLRFLKQF